MATKVECKTCSKCLWEGLGAGGGGTQLPFFLPPRSYHQSPQWKQSEVLAKDKEDKERELSIECNL